ncbi:hypothetical protein [Lactococcus garvieae]|nr:hypothetical protein [Lactococcus garvieae]PCS00290.1 hypothetical protein RU85_GL000710 [Lactococcus garvieae]
MTPSQLDGEDYFELLDVLKSKAQKDRTMDASEAHRRLRNMSA